MGLNRVLGDARITTFLPSAAGSVFNGSLTDDVYIVPSNAVAGAPWCTLNLEGTQIGQVPPSDGDEYQIVDPFGTLSATKPLIVVGRVGSLGGQIANGAAAANSITLNQPGSTLTLVFSSLTSSWNVQDRSQGAYASSVPIVANLAALTALDDSIIPNFGQEFVATVQQPFILNKTSVIAVDGITVVATLSGTGRWLRALVACPQWSAQTTWFQDKTLGNNEGDGSALAPVRDVAEINRRLRVLKNLAYTINSVNGIAATDAVTCNGALDPSAGTSATILILGTLGAPSLTGSFTATTAGIATAAPTVTPSVPVVVGTQLVMTSGAANGAVATVTDDLGAGVFRVSDWALPSSAALSANPAAADTWKVDVRPTVLCPLPLPDAFGHSTTVIFQNFEVTPAGSISLQAFTQRFVYCRFSTVGIVSGLPAYFAQFQGCAFAYPILTTAVSILAAGSAQIINSGAVNAIFESTFEGGGPLWRNMVMSGGGIRNSDSSKLQGGVSTIFTNTRLGIYNSPAVAIRVKNGFTFQALAGAVLYGTGNAIGTDVDEAGVVDLDSTVLPTLTGAVELRLEGSGTAIPALVGGAAVPAASALTTWAQWAAAPFSRNVFGFQKATGARITNRL